MVVARSLLGVRADAMTSESERGAGRSILFCGSSAGYGSVADDVIARKPFHIPIRLPIVFRADGFFLSLYILHASCLSLLASQSSS